MSINFYKKAVLIFFCTSFFYSCVKDKPKTSTEMPPQTTNGVWVGNEGSFGNNNADISFIDLQTNKVYNNLYALVNKKALGDVLQNMLFINDELYLSVNNSNKLEVIDRFTLKQKNTLSNLHSIRNICYANNKIYVGSLYKKALYVYDISTSIFTNLITEHLAIEHMIVKGNFIYATVWDTSATSIYKINCLTNNIQKIPIQVAASHDIVEDKNGNFWILSGNKYKNKKSFLTKYNPITETIEKQFEFTSNDDPLRLTTNTAKDELYFLNIDFNGTATYNGLYKININDTSLPTSPFIKAPANTYFYQIAIRPITDELFLSNPLGFSQQSVTYRYSKTGNLLHTYTTGIGSNQYIFMPQ
jgi:hypothetical protein